MKYVGLIGKIVLALAVGLCLLIATADDSEIAALVPSRPATLLPLLTTRLHAVQAYVRDFQASDFLAAVTAGFRARVRRDSPFASEPQ
jgi:hypothetical protein